MARKKKTETIEQTNTPKERRDNGRTQKIIEDILITLYESSTLKLNNESYYNSLTLEKIYNLLKNYYTKEEIKVCLNKISVKIPKDSNGKDKINYGKSLVDLDKDKCEYKFMPVENFDEYYTLNNDESLSRRCNFVWPSEDYIKSKICQFLRNNQGYTIIYVAWGKRKGTDIIAGRYDDKEGFSYIFIEAKGGSNDFRDEYASDVRSSNAKSADEPVDFDCAIGQILLSMDHNKSNIDYMVGFPRRANNPIEHYDCFGHRWDRLDSELLKTINLRAIFVDSDGKIRITNHGEDNNNNKLYKQDVSLIDHK